MLLPQKPTRAAKNVKELGVHTSAAPKASANTSNESINETLASVRLAYGLGNTMQQNVHWATARCLTNCLYGASVANMSTDTLNNVQTQCIKIAARDVKRTNHCNVNIATALSRIGHNDVMAYVLLQMVRDLRRAHHMFESNGLAIAETYRIGTNHAHKHPAI